ncbi:receptor activity-modifying protein 3 isoform X4 [Lagenorhynchus albirostris]|uniref:receptor activity-modifying protein 3 isoform X4 n=1 Tax=Lagenorhynchus albirostris TaxID=27610 RepID=UPI0028EDB4B2|nr:receptor activity-modifying protein 3 isoform X4 [Lagenorhynchus albirostris]XP_060013439.1 receptor activity-modifying protein 3 isoform X4 [Lagenorhynchus albirostris]
MTSLKKHTGSAFSMVEVATAPSKLEGVSDLSLKGRSAQGFEAAFRTATVTQILARCTQTTTCQKPWCAEEPRHSTSEAASPDGPAGRVGPPLVSGNVTAKQSPTLTTTFPLWKLRPREGRTAHGHMESEHPGLLQPPRPPHASPSWPGARSQLAPVCQDGWGN